MKKNCFCLPGLIIAIVTSLPILFCNTNDSSDSIVAELKALDIDKYIEDVPYESHYPYPADPTWEIYSYNTGVCKCITGNPFHIAVKKKEIQGNAVFLLSGGGACWPGKDSCSKTADYISGWDDSPDHPVKGWNIIHVPYCDGSVHMGDNDADYDNDGVPDHFHRGLKTTTAAVSVMRELFPNPPAVLIMGCSAGGYGTFISYLLIRRFFPESKIYILNDSGPGLWNPDNGMKDLIIDSWKYRDYFPSDCLNCDEQILFLYEWILERDNNVRIGLFSSYYDHTIGTSFLDMQPDAFKTLLVSTSGMIQIHFPNRFKRFFINADSHCISQYTYTVNGVTLLHWIRQLLNDDPAWSDILE